MIDIFKNIFEKEKNEATAFVLMLGVLSEKMTEIIGLLQDLNKKSSNILLSVKTQNSKPKKEILIIEPMTPEDYME